MAKTYNIGSGNEPKNRGLNPPGSEYAELFGAGTNDLVSRVVRQQIYDTAPAQFNDLKLFSMIKREPVNSDEFEWKEAGHQRNPIGVAAAASAVSSPNSQAVQVTNIDHVALSMIVIYPDNSQGTVTSINEASNEVVITPLVGSSVPAVTTADTLAFHAPVESDGTDELALYFRMETITRRNYVQLLSRGLKYGKVEYFKLMKSGAYSNTLSMEKSSLMRQFRIDLSNIIWNGKKGEVVLKNGGRAKTTGGIIPFMIDAGSPAYDATPETIVEAFKQLAIDTEYGDYGDTRMFFAPNEMCLAISEAYKSDKTRYNPNDMIARLMLDQINIGSSKIVLVPYNRFTDVSSFPKSFGRQGTLLDIRNLCFREMWGEQMGEITNDKRGKGGKSLSYEWFVDANIGVEFVNPLASGFLRW
jgi:hypothetical protein